MSRALKVAWLGLRGFPGVQGGVETHAEHLCPRLVELGCEVHVIVRSPYQPREIGPTWRGVRFHPLWAPRSKGLEAILHSILGVLYAGVWLRPDVLHIQAIGPAIVAPLARLLGLTVVVTHHGPDYDRQKWGGLARTVLRLGERFGMRYANARIVISNVIRQLVLEKHDVESRLVPNGVVLPVMPESVDCLAPFGLIPGRYVLIVSRLVPEKRHMDLIPAFADAKLEGWKLAIVGSSDHPDAYTQSVLEAAAVCQDVVCTGFQSGEVLAQLYAHAGMFVLPSSHEGLPIAMLEALSYGLPVVASDIPANLEVGLPAAHYFPLGQVDVLSSTLRRFAAQLVTLADRAERRQWVSTRYDWETIARLTLDVYLSMRS